jgi:catechol 2,3-dioxygenase-like lactoylglutathione lyase family enzyme
MKINGLTQIAQGAKDLDRAEAFYRDQLGLPFIARFDPPGLVFFDLGGPRLLLEVGDGSALLYLDVDDLDARYAELQANGVTCVGDPHVIHRDDAGTFGPAGHEIWMAFFRDSEDNLVALTESRRAR